MPLSTQSTMAAAVATMMLFGAMPAAAQAAKPMNYDCTKAGNKNKAACKAAAGTPTATPAKPATAAMPAPAPRAAKPAVAAAPAATVRPAATPRAGTVAATLKNGKVVHYDCSKKGNQTKAACKR